MRKLSFFVLIGSLILAGCASQPTPNPTQPAAALPTQTAISPADSPTSGPTEPPAETQPQNPPQTSDLLELNIVPGESSVSYEVGETFFNQNNRFNLAVGKTTQISGKITIDPANPQNSSIGAIEVDISQLQSDSNRRDNTIRDRFLEFKTVPYCHLCAEPDRWSPHKLHRRGNIKLQSHG